VHANRKDTEAAAARLRAAFESSDLAAFGAVLDDAVRWGGEEETPETCHSRAEVLERLATQRTNGLRIRVIELVPGAEGVLLGLSVIRPGQGHRERTRYQALKVRDERVVEIRGYESRAEAAARAGVE
jgi:hypothetical protein